MPIPYKGAEGNAVEDSAAADSEAVETNALYVLDENLEMTWKYSGSGKRRDDTFGEIYGRYCLFCDI